MYIDKNIDLNCSYCGVEYPYPKLTYVKNDFYLVLRDMESNSEEYITLCPECVSDMVSTYKIGHKYKFVGVLENTGEPSNAPEGAMQFQEQYHQLRRQPCRELPYQPE